MTQEELLAELDAEGYKNLKLIDGKIVGTLDYITTRGLVVGLDSCGYEYRYCYQDRNEATEALSEYVDLSEHPTGNWIKLKGRRNNMSVDELNPKWVDDDNQEEA